MMKLPKKIAVISDVHSNSFALAAVLEDIWKRKIGQIINLGDSLYGPIDPFGTYRLLCNPMIASIAGNQDRLILEYLSKITSNLTLEFVKREMTRESVEWLYQLPFELHYDDIYCCHGTPQNDEEYLLEHVMEDHVALRNANSIEEKIQKLKQRVVLCGHSHVPQSVHINDKMIINAGSVGLQAYDDESPHYHIMQNNSPQAKYVVVSNPEGEYYTEIVSVDYDFESASSQAEKNGRKDWVQWLSTGKVQ